MAHSRIRYQGSLFHNASRVGKLLEEGRGMLVGVMCFGGALVREVLL